MIVLRYSGWFQCRLSTDPDLYDERRGISGWTFAFGDEPDLDRVIRFHDPVSPRSHAPEVGVFVRGVTINGADQAGHGLIGAPVHLINDAVFEGRNGEIAFSAAEPIAPFHLVISGANAELNAFDPVDLGNAQDVERRKPVRFDPNSSHVLTVTGIGSPAGYRQARAQAVEAELNAETDAARRQALEGRLAELRRGQIRRQSLGFQLEYDFTLRGPNTLSDPNGLLPVPAPGDPWRAQYWMGGWDADGLVGYVDGNLLIG